MQYVSRPSQAIATTLVLLIYSLNILPANAASFINVAISPGGTISAAGKGFQNNTLVFTPASANMTTLNSSLQVGSTAYIWAQASNTALVSDSSLSLEVDSGADCTALANNVSAGGSASLLASFQVSQSGLYQVSGYTPSRSTSFEFSHISAAVTLSSDIDSNLVTLLMSSNGFPFSPPSSLGNETTQIQLSAGVPYVVSLSSSGTSDVSYTHPGEAFDTASFTLTAVPEPASFTAISCVLFAITHRRRK
jgi:hypothetical protein